MITHELIERIEGEAIIDFKTASNGEVVDANIRFVHFRGMEAILENRPALDSLVITPRVCGICGHSHLIAAVEMLESVYRNSGLELVISPKAQSIRQITRLCELLQNHLKWLYLIMLNESGKLLGNEVSNGLKMLYATTQINQLSALFSGQWPHSSYALPGGVTSDPTYIEVMQSLKLCSETERFLEAEVLGCSLEIFESMRDADELLGLKGDFGKVLRNFEQLGLLREGKSHNSFLILGEHPGCEAVSITNNGREHADWKNVSEDDSNTFAQGGNTYAKNALYHSKFYETGPLARAFGAKRGLIESLAKEYGDSALTRISARVDEVVYLLKYVKSLIASLDLSEPSFIPPTKIDNLSGEGTGIVEAPRGTLIHKATLVKGKIAAYSIITPTQWNLGNGTLQNPGIAQKAMIGTKNSAEATLLFRTFDVCSVCTTH